MSVKRKNTTPRPTVGLVYLYKEKKLWLNPHYQREAVWTLSQKQLLIDSLLRDIDIPKLYFREVDKQGYQFEVVDGQQRLRSIIEYFDNGFQLPLESDDVEGHKVKNCKFGQLHRSIQEKLQNATLDITALNDAYSDEDIEEIFLRLQNGTPLNAAEKRKAIAGKMRSVVESLSKHQVFKLCSFKNIRYAHEDAVAKILHLLLSGTITDIRPISIKRTYDSHKEIEMNNTQVKKTKTAFQFLTKSFKNNPSPQLKKYSIISVTYLVSELLDKYDLSNYAREFAKTYLSFEIKRKKNEELPEEDQDTRLAAYTDAARSDSIQDMLYRNEVLRDEIIKNIPELIIKDPLRLFSEEQRNAIYFRDEGICVNCKKKCPQNDFHVDHIKPHAKGGKTKISNGQLLCPECNLKKGGKA